MGVTETERSLRDKMAAAHNEMRVVMEKMDRGETLSVEDRTAFDAAHKALGEHETDLRRHLDWRKAEAERTQGALERGVSRDQNDSEVDAYATAYRKWFRWGVGALNEEDRSAMFPGRFMGPEVRVENPLSTAPASGVDGSAGFLVPQGFWHNLQIALKQYGGMLGLCNIIRTDTGNPMPWPTTDPTAQVGAYIGENAQLTSNTNIEFGQGMMHAWFIKSGIILASLAIINDSAFDVDSFVSDRMGEQIGRKVAAELHTGAGAASSALTGINPSLVAWAQTNTNGATPANGGYYKPAAASTAFYLGSPTTAVNCLSNALIPWSAILGMIGTVDPAYRQAGQCTWLCNDATQQMLRSLTDGFGHPLWVPDVTVGPAEGAVARIYGFPVQIDQNTENVSTTASTAGGLLFGDFKRAMIVRQVNQMGTMRLAERYADFLQVGYLSYVRMDSLPNDLRAIAQYVSPAS